MHRLMRACPWVVVASLAGLIVAVGGVQAVGEIASAPPGDPYAKVSDLVPLPDFIPGLGTLYVNPATLPVGPFLAYDREGRLVQLVFMVPLEDLNARELWTDLAGEPAGRFAVDHVDMDYNPGHPGVEQPHYHIRLVAVSHAEEQEAVGP